LASCTSALGKKNTHTPMYCLYCHGVHGFACLHVQTEYHVKNMCNI
jgi:ribosomal protein L37E